MLNLSPEIEAVFEEQATEERFTLTAFEAVRMDSRAAYLVKGLIPRSGLVVIWGSPKCGKSFWTFDLGMHIARGADYRGRRVQQGPVVYVALEGSHGFRGRIEAYRRGHRVTDAPFYLVTDPLDLVHEHEALIAAISEQIGSIMPVAVCIDTLNRSLTGSESKDEDMSAYVRAADAVRNTFGCAVLIVHHCGVDGSRPRGHTSLTGAADTQISVSRDSASNIVVKVEWMKDGAEGDVIVSRLEKIALGEDEDGEPQSSCVVRPAEASTAARTTSRKLSDRQRLALDALAECAATIGKAAPASLQLPARTIVVPITAWREELFVRGVLDRDASSPREDFRRLKNSLQARGLIGVRDDLVWRA